MSGKRISFYGVIQSTSITQPFLHPMLSAKPIYDPSTDCYITTLYLDHNEEGECLDVDSMIYHNETGFYLARKIIQVWNGSWETATDVEAMASLREHRRSLNTFRSLTTKQTIRLIVENSVPEEEGARELALAALDAADIK